MSLRAFVAVDVPPSQELERAIEGLRGFGRALKPVLPANVHITLKFLGEIDEGTVPGIEAAMRRAVEGVRPFALRLVGIGAFPSTHSPRVIWTGIEGAEPLAKMAAALEEGCEPLGFPRERRPFSPHLTLARVREGQRPDLHAFLEMYRGRDLGSFQVDRVRLKRSVLTPSGPIYSDVLELPL